MKFRIKELLKERGMTALMLANNIDMTQAGLSIALSEKGNPSLSTLKKIASALDVEVIELFEPNNSDFTALIDSKGELHRFDNIESLERFIASIKSDK